MQMTVGSSRPRVEVFSHHFTVYVNDERIKRACSDLARGLVEWTLDRIPGPGKARFQRVPSKVYASATQDRKEMRFNINQLDEFFQFLEAYGIRRESVEIVHHPLYEPTKADLVWISPKEPFPTQLPLIEYLAQPIDQPPNSRVICAMMGQGKGLMSVQALLRLGVRTAIVVRAQYLEKWVEELEEFLDLKPGDLMVVRGGAQMVSVMNLALAGELQAKILLIGNKGMQMYFKAYEHGKTFDDEYPIHPEDFYKKLGVGIRVIDEVHQDFHLNFKQDTYAHIPVTFSLSATLDSDQELLNRMYRLMWPVNTRGPVMPYDPYIAVSCLWFRAEKPDRIRHLNFKRQYSHVEFENSISRNSQMLANYLKIPELIVQTKYAPNMEPGQKMLIFCSTVSMCAKVVEHLQGKFPQFTIAKYTGEDDWEQLHNNDIVVSTIQSAGTAVDIKNLRYTLLTVALSSKQTNHQVLGRLRKLKDWPDVTPEFMFTACQNIGKHQEYALAKKSKLHGKVKVFSQAFLPVVV